MATKPTSFPVFDVALTNTAAISGGHQANGYANNEVPAANEFNTILNLIYVWLLYLYTNCAVIARKRMITPYNGTGTTPVIGTGFGGYTASKVLLGCGGTAGTGDFDLDIPVGYQIQSISFRSRGTSGASQTLTFTMFRDLDADSPPTTIAAVPAIAVSTTDTLYTINFVPVTSGVSITVATSAGNTTYTRASGSYLTDGYFVGQQVNWTGFVNGANNVTHATITVLTATVMTVVNTGVAEVLAGSCTGYMPVADITSYLRWHLAYANPSTQTMGAADVKRLYKHAAIIGAVLALVCHTVPPQYRVLCDQLANFCKGL
jgi:hypothetical protein